MIKFKYFFKIVEIIYVFNAAESGIINCDYV
jgi:hypothetical protein